MFATITHLYQILNWKNLSIMFLFPLLSRTKLFYGDLQLVTLFFINVNHFYMNHANAIMELKFTFPLPHLIVMGF